MRATVRLARLGAGTGMRRAVVAARLVSPRWRKVLRDLWSHKARSLLVILSIAIGGFAIGVIAGVQQILSGQLAASYLATHPADATLGVAGFDDDLVQAAGPSGCGMAAGPSGCGMAAGMAVRMAAGAARRWPRPRGRC